MEEIANYHSGRDRTRLKRLIRWRSDVNEIASDNWYRVLRDLTTERGLWGQQELVSKDPTNRSSDPVFWKINTTEDGQRRRRLLIRNYQGTKHEGRQPSLSRSVRDSNLAKADLDASKTDVGGLWQELMAASALRLPSVSRTTEGLSNSVEVVNDDDDDLQLFDDDFATHETNHFVSHSPQHLAQQQQPQHSQLPETETPLLSIPCDLIVPMLELTAVVELYHASVWVVIDNEAMDALTPDERILLKPQRIQHWKLNDLRDLATRRYQMQHNAVEFFISNGTQCFVSLRTAQARQQLCHSLRHLMPDDFAPFLYLSPLDRLKRSGATEAWLKREMTTFEYLMVVNRMAGRTYEDLGQYPVFPWILNDYKSKTIDLSNSKYYRDLKKPMGAQSVAREARFREKYDNYHNMEDMAGDMDMMVLMGPASMYGTHYSNPGTVISYLMRMEPFMSYHVQLQDGRFDKPDRQILSIAKTFEGCTADNNDTDVKELIPEYFYNPDILVNSNHVDFGTTSKGIQLNDVVLPPWADGSPEQFIRIQRNALESEYVSANLHHWIDMIFGIKQRPPFLDDGSELAVEACNVFFHITYEGAVDMDVLAKSRPGMLFIFIFN